MSRKKRKAAYRSQQSKSTTTTSNIGFLLTDEAHDMLVPEGYTRLDRVPQIVAGFRRIAELAGAMTIHLMANTDSGDVRIKNELSRQIDINPSKHMTRSTWIEAILMNLFLYGDGNAIVRVKTKNGLLDDLQVIPADRFSLVADPTGYDYTVMVDGVQYSPDDVLHFIYNPDPNYPWKGQGIRFALKDLAENLRQASATEKGFMQSKWKPSLVVKVDALTDEFSSPTGRRKLLDDYIATSRAGEPWVVPAEAINVEQVKPLSLSDLAINDSVKLDTQTVAALIGVPAFVLGVGQYSQKEWNNFIQSKLKPVMTMMQQEMTKKLILSPKWYLKFDIASLLDYDLQTISAVYTTLQDRGDVTGNEVRDRLGMSPMDGLDELKVLENYIPNDMIALQSKLNGGNSNGEE